MTRCRYCGGDIFWKEEGGRWRPYNLDGGSHFAICRSRQRALHQAAKAAETRERPVVQRFIIENSKPELDYPRGYCPCRHDVPPWELCAACPVTADS